MIAARSALGMSRQVFFVGLGGFDTHDTQQQRHARLLAQLNHSLAYFDSVTSQMGVSDLIWGRLTDAMRVDDGGTIEMERYVHPRCEPEIAFLIGKEIAGPITLLEAQNAVEAIAPAIEIIDSRYEGFKFTWTDVVADNASSSGFVVGSWHRRIDDITNLGMVLRFDGMPVQVGSSAGILGQPYRALADASRLVALAGERLMPGDIVLAGAATSAEALRPGVSVSLGVQNLGTAEFQVAE